LHSLELSAWPSDHDRRDDQDLGGKSYEARRGRFHDAHFDTFLKSEAIPLPKPM
jgi:hypothetical protein